MQSSRLTRMIALILVSLVFSACSTSQIEPTQIPVSAAVTPVPTATIPNPFPQGESEHTLSVDGIERSYLLYIPAGLDSQQPVPIVFAFHGYTTSPTGIKRSSNLNSVSDQQHFLVIYPWGFGRSWNTGERGPGDAIEQNIDDSAFIREMLAELESFINIDHKRIYAVGFSQGGAFVYRLACDMAETFAAVASVSGYMGYDNCSPTQAVSLLHFHGLKDYNAPFSGSEAKNIPPVKDGINFWVDFNECETPGLEEKIGDEINHTAYISCRDGTIVELYTNDTRGHIWPEWFLTPASEYIWEFFAAHPKP